jgi:hypothetical protein
MMKKTISKTGKFRSGILRLSVSVGIILSIGLASVFAQKRPTMMQNRQMNIDTLMTRMTQRLNLSNDQQAKVKEIFTERIKQRNEALEQMGNLRKDTHNNILKILNKDQVAEFQKMKNRFWMNRRGNRHHMKFNRQYNRNNWGGSKGNAGTTKGKQFNADSWVYMAMARLTQRLDLSSDQQAKIKNVLTESAQKHQQMWQAMSKQRQDTQQKLQSILSKQQIAEWQKMKDQRMKRFSHRNKYDRRKNYDRRGRMSGQGMKPMGTRSGAAMNYMMQQMSQRLNLTAEQEQKVKDIFAEHFQERMKTMQEMRMNNNVDRTAIHNQMIKSRQELENKLQKILNKDQMEEFKKMHDEMWNRMQQQRPGMNRNR